MTVDATAETFPEFTASGNVLIDVWGSDCIPCVALMPLVERLAEEYAGRVSVLILNAPENRKLCRELRVAGLPAYLTMRDGVEVERVTGAGATAATICRPHRAIRHLESHAVDRRDRAGGRRPRGRSLHRHPICHGQGVPKASARVPPGCAPGRTTASLYLTPSGRSPRVRPSRLQAS
jgi:thioredoxin 1